jgi:hypothetical protein
MEQQPHLLLHLQQFASTWPAWQSYLASVGPDVLQELLLQMTKPDRVLRAQLVMRWVVRLTVMKRLGLLGFVV